MGINLVIGICILQGTVTILSRVWVNQFVWDKDRDFSIVVVENKEDFVGIISFVRGGLFVDLFRYFYLDQTGVYINWCILISVREINYGRRLDYIFINVELVQSDFKDCVILVDVEGLDYCLVKVEYMVEFISVEKCFFLCTKYMLEFCGKQIKFFFFFMKREKIIENIIEIKISQDIVD